MTALLTDNLPLLAGAPNGIKKLRELILELAVRGNLVPQDSNDEPASELLKRIAAEKTELSPRVKKLSETQTGEVAEYREGVRISNLSSKALASTPMRLPPLAEKHRIVAKVDQLMALCEKTKKPGWPKLACSTNSWPLRWSSRPWPTITGKRQIFLIGKPLAPCSPPRSLTSYMGNAPSVSASYRR